MNNIIRKYKSYKEAAPIFAVNRKENLFMRIDDDKLDDFIKDKEAKDWIWVKKNVMHDGDNTYEARIKGNTFIYRDEDKYEFVSPSDLIYFTITESTIDGVEIQDKYKYYVKFIIDDMFNDGNSNRRLRKRLSTLRRLARALKEPDKKYDIANRLRDLSILLYNSIKIDEVLISVDGGKYYNLKDILELFNIFDNQHTMISLFFVEQKILMNIYLDINTLTLSTHITYSMVEQGEITTRKGSGAVLEDGYLLDKAFNYKIKM